MKRFKIRFIISLLFIVLITTAVFPSYSFAEVDKQYIGGEQFENKDYHQVENTKIPGLPGDRTVGDIIKDGLGKVLSLVRILALGVAAIMLVVIATKYMSGSARVKAQLKTDIPTYLIGAVVLFGTAGFLRIIEWFITDVL